MPLKALILHFCAVKKTSAVAKARYAEVNVLFVNKVFEAKNLKTTHLLFHLVLYH